MENLLIKRGTHSLSEIEIIQWTSLYAECFKSDLEIAQRVFKKYRLHSEDAWFCLGFVDGNLVASYSGIARMMGPHSIFLSTDTMSNNILVNATCKLGNKLYQALAENGIKAVCGFPNKNIVKIRERKLGWIMRGRLRFFVGIPLLWRFGRPTGTTQVLELWRLVRPDSGFFGNPIPRVAILSRDGHLWSSRIASLVLAGASQRPGPFFIEIPHRLVQTKVFGYRLLAGSYTLVREAFEVAAEQLDIDCIDVP